MYPAQANRPAINRKPNSTIGERRRRVRHRVHTPAYVGINASPAATALDLSEILDISEEGACIQAILPLQPNRIVNLGLDLSEGNARINVAGLVVWTDSHGRTGVQFLDMPEASRGSLKEWLFLNALSACDSVVSAPPPDRDVTYAGVDGLAWPSIGPQQNAAPEAFTMPSDPSLTRPAGVGPATERRDAKTARSDLDLRLQRITDRALSLTRATGAAIALMRGDQMICVARAGTDAPGLGARLQMGSGFSGECVRTQKLLCCDDSESDDRVDRETCRVLGIRSIVAVPICSGGTVSGLLEVFSPKVAAFSANDLSPLERLAHDVLLAIDWSVGMPASRRVVSEPGLPQKLPVEARPVGPSAPVPQARYVSLPKPPRGRRSAARRSGKVILAGAIVILVVSGLSLVVPWIRTWERMPWRAHAEVPAKPQAIISKPAASTAARSADPVNDFTGMRRLAEQGDPVAQYAVGLHYAQGEDVPQDYTEAARWFSQAAEQGHIAAQATLGGLYWAGRGVPKDVTKAYFWLVLARAGGYERSKDLIGPVTAEMTRNQVFEAQQAANEWLTHHQRTSNPIPLQPDAR